MQGLIEGSFKLERISGELWGFASVSIKAGIEQKGNIA